MHAGSGYVCATPVTIRGGVSDALSGGLVAESRIVVLGAQGSPVGDVSYSDDDGKYSVAVSAPRNADGSLARDAKWTLAVSAQGYQVFPAGPRPAVPIFASQASGNDASETAVIEAANTKGLDRRCSARSL